MIYSSLFGPRSHVSLLDTAFFSHRNDHPSRKREIFFDPYIFYFNMPSCFITKYSSTYALHHGMPGSYIVKLFSLVIECSCKKIGTNPSIAVVKDQSLRICDITAMILYFIHSE
jgi:hypothetical protein